MFHSSDFCPLETLGIGGTTCRLYLLATSQSRLFITLQVTFYIHPEAQLHKHESVKLPSRVFSMEVYCEGLRMLDVSFISLYDDFRLLH